MQSKSQTWTFTLQAQTKETFSQKQSVPKKYFIWLYICLWIFTTVSGNEEIWPSFGLDLCMSLQFSQKFSILPLTKKERMNERKEKKAISGQSKRIVRDEGFQISIRHKVWKLSLHSGFREQSKTLWTISRAMLTRPVASSKSTQAIWCNSLVTIGPWLRRILILEELFKLKKCSGNNVFYVILGSWGWRL